MRAILITLRMHINQCITCLVIQAYNSSNNHIKGAIRRYCFVYIKPFNFVNSQNDIDAILSYPVIGLHGTTAKEVI